MPRLGLCRSGKIDTPFFWIGDGGLPFSNEYMQKGCNVTYTSSIEF